MIGLWRAIVNLIVTILIFLSMLIYLGLVDSELFSVSVWVCWGFSFILVNWKKE